MDSVLNAIFQDLKSKIDQSCITAEEFIKKSLYYKSLVRKTTGTTKQGCQNDTTYEDLKRENRVLNLQLEICKKELFEIVNRHVQEMTEKEVHLKRSLDENHRLMEDNKKMKELLEIALAKNKKPKLQRKLIMKIRTCRKCERRRNGKLLILNIKGKEIKNGVCATCSKIRKNATKQETKILL